MSMKGNAVWMIKDMGHSPEVGPLQILHVLFLLGNGQAPSDIPSDTKISIRWVQKLSFLKNFEFH